jgi:hypothetical protein
MRAGTSADQQFCEILLEAGRRPRLRANLRRSWLRWRGDPRVTRSGWWVVARGGIPREIVEVAVSILEQEPADPVTIWHRVTGYVRLGCWRDVLDVLDRGRALERERPSSGWALEALPRTRPAGHAGRRPRS